MEFLIDPNSYVTQDLILLFLSTTGMIIILVRSDLFKTPREIFSRKYMEAQKRVGGWWFLHKITNCELCCSPWMATICYLLIYFGVYFVIYILCVPTFVFLYFKIIDIIGRKV